MNISANLQTQLETILYGQAWYGTPIYTILESVSFEAAYEKPERASHSIAEIVAHMLAWTEETINRLQGNQADLPLRGDWPVAGMPDEQKWLKLIASFKLANVELIQLISGVPNNKWADMVNDSRGIYSGHAATYQGLVMGIIQHHVYHAGQIALLNKIINGQ